MTNESEKGKEKKNVNFSEWYSNIIEKAEIVDLRLGIKGFITIRPWGTQIIEKLFDMFEEELQRKGHLPVIMPSVIPESNLKKESSHIKGFTPQVFWLETEKGEERLALRPTSETVFTPMFSLWIRSHRDLPMKLYQRGSVFRYDTKATRPLIRGREFQWIECHDAFATKKDAEAQVQEDIDTTEKILHEKLGIPFFPMKRPQWDKFAGAEYTIGSDVLMPDGKMIQQPSTHLMGQKFSRAFNAKFKTVDGREDYLYTTAYGPAMSRILVSIISTHGDDSGLVLPFSVSPIQVFIVPIYTVKNKRKIMKYSHEILAKLHGHGIKSKLDSREDYSPGWKFHESELKGIPFRIEIGEKEMKSKKVTLFIRDTKKKQAISVAKLGNINKLGKDYDERLKKNADLFVKNKIINCKTKADIKKTVDNGKIARVNFCSIQEQGVHCAEVIEKEIGAEVRGTLANKNEKPTGNCAICNKKTEAVVYIAKSY
ncbi:MAG: proline--tRNA ligase [Candidatus Pacearchaeota archaeon]|jgi:prolyl-tRNA synthetase